MGEYGGVPRARDVAPGHPRHLLALLRQRGPPGRQADPEGARLAASGGLQRGGVGESGPHLMRETPETGGAARAVDQDIGGAPGPQEPCLARLGPRRTLERPDADYLPCGLSYWGQVVM